jgi:hypothetical protein
VWPHFERHARDDDRVNYPDLAIERKMMLPTWLQEASMRMRSLHPCLLVSALFLAATTGCKSDPDKSDGGVIADTAPALADSGGAIDHSFPAQQDTRNDVSIQGGDGPADAPPSGEAGLLADAASTDGAGAADAAVVLDTGTPGVDATSAELGTSGVDGAGAKPDGTLADAAFVPGPATPIVVNSGPTGDYNLPNGTWKVFYFDVVAGQMYAVAGLSATERGFVSTDPQVSPSNYQMVTDATGVLSFVAAAAQRTYVAVAATGGGVSGYFQVADGGIPVALGKTTLSLTAPHGDDTYVYRFPISAGHGYVMNLTGPAQPNVGIAVSPKATRSLGGQFSDSAWSVAGSLPFTNEAITPESVAMSYSGYYFFQIRVTGTITFTVDIAQSP